ncbi:cytochrome P450 [Whalleya microplaca]|nr:cytochrome P450 [Whalleya microplaca]
MGFSMLLSLGSWATTSTLGGFFVLYLLGSTLVTWYRLCQFKGPFLASISRLWAIQTVLSDRPDVRYAETQERYGGPLVRVAPDTLITDDLEVVRRINSVRAGYKRSSWYHSFRINPYEQNMISTTDDAFHTFIKSRTAGGYSLRDVPSIENDIDDTLAELVTLLRKKYVSTEDDPRPVDWANVAEYFTLDTLSKVSYGKSFGCLKADRDVHDFVESSKSGMSFMTLCAEVPFLRAILTSTLFLALAGPKTTDTKGVGVLMRLSQEAVTQRFKPDSKDQPDMIGSFIRNGLSQKQVESEALLQIIAGSDSTAISIRCTMLFLTTTPHAYRRLQEEIDQAIGEGKVSSPITYAEAKTLPYLQAVIHETRRYHPINTATFPKVVPPQGDTLAGQFVPGGTKIGINQRGLMRNKKIFGADPDVFRPERWLGVSSAQHDQMTSTVDLLFGQGRYICSGKPLAVMELNKVFVELLREFDFQLINVTKPWDVEFYTNIFISNQWMRITDRQL